MADNEAVLLKAYPPHPILVERTSEVLKANERLAEAVDAIFKECKHEVVFKCDYSPSQSGMFGAMPPLLQCASCLAERDEWGHGHKALGVPTLPDSACPKTTIEISRDAFYARRA